MDRDAQNAVRRAFNIAIFMVLVGLVALLLGSHFLTGVFQMILAPEQPETKSSPTNKPL